MEQRSQDAIPHATEDFDRYEDATLLARRAGIGYVTLIDPALRARFESLVPPPADGQPHEPLFHLLVPFRFVAGRNRTACRFEFVIGRRKLSDNGIAVRVDFCRDEARGRFFALSLAR